MHCVSIDFDGFKRLSDTRCNTDTRLLAFVGPNEAGKSSLLQALVWLTQVHELELAPRDHTRGRDLDDEHVAVGATYELNDAELGLVAELPVAKAITGFRLERRVDGRRGSDARPTPHRHPKPFEDFEKGIERGRKDLRRRLITRPGP